MQANDAMRILGSAAAMGLLGGGGALAYNATSKPILDEYGNVIESNDINPVMAALGSAAIGAVGSGIYGKMNQPVAKPVQGVSVGTSPKPQQSPDIDIDVTPAWQEDVQKEIDVFRNEVANLRGQLLQKRNDYAQGVNDLREASIPIRQVVPAKPDRANGLFEVPKEYEGFTQVLGKDGKKYVRIPNGQGSNLIRLDDLQEGTTSEKRFVPQLSSEQEALYAEAKRLGISPYELEERGWKYNPNQPTVKVVPASPMQMQNPMTPHGMRTVVIQPMKEPGQEMIEEALRLKELARQQGNPSVPYDVFGEADGYWEAQKKRA
jgi:hypothetical protein